MVLWKDELRAFAKARNLEVYESDLGLGIEFQDGCDAFWVLPGEVMSTVDCTKYNLLDAKKLVEIYENTNRMRDETQRIIRHYLAEHGFIGILRRTGQWGWQRSDSYYELDVGAQLTNAIRRNLSLEEIFQKFYCIDGLEPSPQRVAEYLRASTSPVKEVLVSSEREWAELNIEDDHESSIMSVVDNLVKFSALNDFKRLDDMDLTDHSVVDNGHIADALRAVGRRLPKVAAIQDGRSAGVIKLEFDDELDSFAIDTSALRSRKLVVERDTNAIADEIVSEYKRLNGSRKAILSAIWDAAAELGWSRETRWGEYGASDQTIVRLCRETEEISFKAGTQLTQVAGESSSADAIADLFDERCPFVIRCIENFNKGAKFSGRLPEKHLPAKIVRGELHAIELVESSAKRIAAMDTFADEKLAEFFLEEDVFRDYEVPSLLKVSHGDLRQMSEWVAAAYGNIEATPSGEHIDANALRILIDAGEPNLDRLLSRYFQKMRADIYYADGQPFVSTIYLSEADCSLVWEHRHAHPELASALFSDSCFDRVVIRARLGDPVASRLIRHKQIDIQSVIEESLWAELNHIDLLDEQQREIVKQHILHWAATTDYVSPPDDQALEIAYSLNLPEVCVALESNPHLLTGLLTNRTQMEPADVPGVLVSSVFLTVWSRLNPGEFLMRLLLTAREMNLVDVASEAFKQRISKNPNSSESLPELLQMYRRMNRVLAFHVAFAWKCCQRQLADVEVDR